MTQKKSIYGLVGYPVEHSLSPLMHNTAFRELGAKAEYKLFSLKEDELTEFFTKLKSEKSPIFGLNVTVPYKEIVIPFLDTLSPFAEKVKAVNTIVIDSNRRLIGYNTDGPGFLTHLAELGFEINNKRVAILGAGGACRALVSSLCLIPEHPDSIKIFDVDQGKAENLIRDLNTRLDVSEVESVDSMDDLNIELSDLLINATPVGMKEDDRCMIEEGLFHRDMLVYDLIYNPEETPLLKLAKKCGAKTSNGLGMLFYQGVLAFQHWANQELSRDIKIKMRHSLIEGTYHKK